MSREWRETVGYLTNAGLFFAWALWAPSPFAAVLSAAGGFQLGMCASMWAVKLTGPRG